MAEQKESLLGGYRVLDLADEKGILCGKLLGDLGADVIKIERPGGDEARNIGPFYKDIPDPEKSLYWFFTNTSKLGITLDIETPDGKEIFKRLVQTADFVVESFEPGYMGSLGLGYEELEEINPGIIMTSITPFGQSGPYAHYKTSDIVCSAMGGLMQIFGDPDRPPVRVSCDPQSYFLGSLHGALGSMVAHYHRELTGEGQHVDVSIQQAVVLSLMLAVELWDIYRFNYRGTGPFVRGVRAGGGFLSLRYIHPCKDGHVIYWPGGGAQAGIVTSTTRLVQWANEEGMCLDLKDYNWSQWDTSTMSQEEIDSQLKSIGEFFLTKTKAELLDRAVKESMLIAPVSTIKDLAENPQLAARDFWQKVEHSELGDTITYPGPPVKMAETPWRIQHRAPLIGEHNEDIYERELGFSKEELVLLKTRGVI
jgi:crotonobetainyl-CoA:carnitine CoA-transferase CaiB-like acyl-CoA transferase